MRKIKIIKGKIYHILNRGANKGNIFIDDRDRWRFLQGFFLFNDINVSNSILFFLEKENKGRINFTILKEFIKTYQKDRMPLVRIMADCLMPNHFHLLVEEINEGGISLFMHKLGVGYTKYFNKKYNRVGSLFQGPFKAVPVEDDIYLKHLLVYINLVNPAQLIEPNLKEEGVNDIGKIMGLTENNQWSTHPEYLGNRNSIIIDKGLLGEIFSDPRGYREFSRNVLLSKQYKTIDNFTLE